MKPLLKHKGMIVGGEVEGLDDAITHAELWECEGKIVEIIIKEHVPIRSLSMNSYYWAEVVPKVRMGLHDLGNRLTLSETDEWIVDFLKSANQESTHEFLKDRFIEKIKVGEETGDVDNQVASTRTLNNRQFKDYIDQIVQFAAETLHVQILSPGEQGRLSVNDDRAGADSKT